MSSLELRIERLSGAAEPLRLTSPSLVVAGYTGRDVAAVEKHVAELAELGVPPPAEVPAFWTLPNWLLTVVDEAVEVGPSASSGEAEPVLIRAADGALYVTVGSDHTDRDLEATSIPLAKTVCPKPVAGSVWPFEEVAAGWDDLGLRSFVGTDEEPYQADTLVRIRPPLELLARAAELVPSSGRSLVLFLGTIPILAEGFRYEPRFTAVLEDGTHGRQLSCSYSVDPIRERTEVA
jgi:hypothetical protein